MQQSMFNGDMTMFGAIRPFALPYAQADVDDLKRRLRSTRGRTPRRASHGDRASIASSCAGEAAIQIAVAVRPLAKLSSIHAARPGNRSARRAIRESTLRVRALSQGDHLSAAGMGCAWIQSAALD